MDVIGFMRADRAYFEDYVTRSTHASNRIEGNTLTLGETYAILWNDNSMVVSVRPRELYEAINHKFALAKAIETIDDELSESLIKEIAVRINRNINDISGYRRSNVVIMGAEHLPPAAREVPQLMMQLVYQYHHDGRDPFEREAWFHIQFERVHPFGDGNGRTGRILIARGLIRDGLPPAVISADERAAYLECLSTFDVEGLAKMLRSASERERSRMAHFASVEE